MLQPLATPSHTSPQWTVTNPTLVAPRPLRYPTLVAPHPLRPSAHYHPYQPPRHTRVPPRLRVVPSPAEALARISLIDHPTPPPEVPDESGSQKYGTVSTLSSETLEEFLRILRNGGGVASPVQTPETQPVITDCVTSASPGSAPLASAPAVWDRCDVSRTPDAPVPSTAPILPAPEWVGRSAHASSCVIRKRTRTQSQSPTREHDRWSHPYRRDTGSRTGSEKSNKRGSSFCEPTLVRPSPRRAASKRASASSWASSETDVSEPADLGSSQNEDVDVELASNRGDVDDEELLTRSADTELDSSTCEDAPKTHSVRGRMSCTPASPISRKHTSNPLAHYSPMLFETLAARARANAFSPSHSRSPSPVPVPHIPDPLDDEEDGDPDEYQPESVVRMEMPRSSQSPPSTP